MATEQMRRVLERGQACARWGRRLTGVVVCAVLLGTAAPAAAQDARRLEAGAPEAAEQRYLIGRNLYLEGRFEEAAAEFQTALDLFPESAKLTYNLARTSERLGRIRDAARLYERYLEISPDARDRPQVERVLRSLARRIDAESAELVLQSDPPGAEVYVGDAGEPLSGQTPTRVRLPPGAHVLTFRLQGYAEASAAVEVEPGEARAISVQMLSMATPTEAASWRPVVGWSMLGVGLAVGAGLGAVFLGEASDAREEADSLGVHPDEASRYDDLEAEHAQARTLGAVSIAAGALTAIVGAGFLLWPERGGSDRAAGGPATPGGWAVRF